MTSIIRKLIFVLTVLSLPAIAEAQGGCVNSPESPTAVLALIGGAAVAVSVTRKRMKI